MSFCIPSRLRCLHPPGDTSQLTGCLETLTRSCSSYSVHAETICVSAFRFIQRTEYVAIWRHIQDDIFCFWTEQFPCVQYYGFQPPFGSNRPINRNKSLTFLQICNNTMQGVALKTYSRTFQVVLNFVNFLITGEKTAAQNVHFHICKNMYTCYSCTIRIM